MSFKRCEDTRDELLPGYALDALDQIERLTAEAHLGDCPECLEEAQRIAEALHATLGQSVDPADPSPLVRTQFLARLALEMKPMDAQGVPARPAAPLPTLVMQTPRPAAGGTPRPGGQAPATRWIMTLAAIPTALALAFGIIIFHMQGQIDDQRGHPFQLAFDTPHDTMLLRGPAQADGMSGEVIVPKNGTAGLVIVSGLGKMPSAMTATCWLHRNGQWMTSGALAPASSGIAMVVLDHAMNLQGADRVAITMQPSAAHPTTPTQPILSAAL